MDLQNSGELFIDGRMTTALRDRALTGLRRKRIGFVLRFFQLLPTLCVLECAEAAAIANTRLRLRDGYIAEIDPS